MFFRPVVRAGGERGFVGKCDTAPQVDTVVKTAYDIDRLDYR